jgi:hypothetical protein
MDKLIQKLPIRSKQLHTPVVLLANINQTHFMSLGAEYYKPLYKSLKSQENLGQPILLVANVTNPLMTIEQRAENLTQKIKKVTSKYEKVHLIAHSFSGIDARCAISMMGLHKKVHSLTTLSSPHHGCAVIEKANKNPHSVGNISHTEKAIEALGLSMANAQEFSAPNMAAFNKIATDRADVGYYSFGSKQKEMAMSEMLRANYQKITDHRLEIETDGIMCLPDVKWGKYLVTFEHDHLEVAGLNPRVYPRHVAALLIDNLRVHDVRSFDEAGGRFA